MQRLPHLTDSAIHTKKVTIPRLHQIWIIQDLAGDLGTKSWRIRDFGSL